MLDCLFDYYRFCLHNNGGCLGEWWEFFVFGGGGLFTLLIVHLVLQIDYSRALNCDVGIKNDGFYYQEGGFIRSFAFYKIQEIEYYENCISVKPFVVLQRDLLVEGEWSEFITLLKGWKKLWNRRSYLPN